MSKFTCQDNILRYVLLSLDTSIYDLAEETPLNKAKLLTRKLNNNIYLKREDLQPIHSFKIRGSYNKIKRLKSTQEGEFSVIAASAGNHAQGVALSAKKLGIQATIVMPKQSPQLKINAVTGYGAQVILHGDSFDEARDYANALAEKDRKSILISAFDDEDVIAGQATCGLEILQQLENIDYIFVPVGGGGLISGILAVVKTIRPEVKIIGVEAEESASLKYALEQGQNLKLQNMGNFADGVAVGQIGDLNFEICKDYLDELIIINNDEICAAIKDIYEDTRTIAEPSGAVATAGVKKYVQQNDLNNKNIVSVLTGANMNFNTLGIVTQRAAIGENSEAVFAVCLPEECGAFRAFMNHLRNRIVTDFSYRNNGTNEGYILVTISTNGQEDRLQLQNDLRDKGYKLEDLNNDEITKNHIRYMVGGSGSNGDKKEETYEITISNKNNALKNLLDILDDKWNISLFHYKHTDTC